MTTWRLERGAILDEGGVRFSVWAPRAQRVDVVLEGGSARSPSPPREKAPFRRSSRASRNGALYRFRLDGERERPDPVSRCAARRRARLLARRRSARRSRGRTAAGAGSSSPSLVLYELHVGTFTPEGTFDGGDRRRCRSLRDLGVTAIELMPVAEFPGARNWGYDGVHLYAPAEHLRRPRRPPRGSSTPRTRRGLAVVLDVVYNHLGPEGNYLGEFGPYFTDRYRTPWGAALNFDGAGQRRGAPLRHRQRALLGDASIHVDGLRLDAVHAIFDFGARHILEELATAVHEQAAAARPHGRS